MSSTAVRETGKGWDPEDIKAAVRKRGTTLSALSRSLKLNEDACRLALRHQWPKCEAAIAKVIGVPPWRIWPERYTTDHRPAGPRRSKRPLARRGRR